MLRGARVLDDLRENQATLKAAQEQEHRQNERFEAALGNMSQGLCMFGADHRLIVTNRRLRDIYELSREAVVPGRSMIDVLQGSPLFAPPHGATVDAKLVEYVEFTLRRDSATLTQPDPNNDVLVGNTTGRAYVALEETHVVNSQIVNAARCGVAANAAQFHIDDFAGGDFNGGGGVFDVVDAFVETNRCFELALQRSVGIDVVVAEGLLDHNEEKLIELLKQRCVLQAIGGIGVHHQA